jgi:UDP-glucuronate 4-epimerase
LRYLVTGTAGFIGFHLARRLLADGHTVAGIDGMTAYYDVTLKASRHRLLSKKPRFHRHEFMLDDIDRLKAVVREEQPEVMIHLAAQAGVRYSIENPRAYADSNLIGTFNFLEATRVVEARHVLVASTSSVYGGNETTPFKETDRADYPLTLYASTKKATELMAHSHAHTWGIPITVFRCFTVYGPWGRPDMALFKFVEAIIAGQPIEIYGQGNMSRDFTFIDDLVECIVRLVGCVPEIGKSVSGDGVEDSLSPVAPHRVVNIGGGHPVQLLEFIEEIENALGRRAKRNYVDMQMGDVRDTSADLRLLERLIGFQPETPVKAGVRAFVDWYAEHRPS